MQEVLLLLGGAFAAHAALDDAQQWLKQFQDQGVLRLFGHQHFYQVQYLWPEDWESAQAEAQGRQGQLRVPDNHMHTHSDLEVPSELLLLLQLVLLLLPGLDAQLLLCK